MQNIEDLAKSSKIKPMSMAEILEGINDAECLELLCEHLRKVSAQVSAGYPICCQSHWMQAQELTKQRLDEFSQRIYH